MAAQDYYGSSSPYLPTQPSYAPQQPSYGAGAGENDPSKIQSLVSMGFTEAQARKALRETNGDVARAVDWLFAHPEEQGQSYNHLAPPTYGRPTSAHSDYGSAYNQPTSPGLPPRPTSTQPDYTNNGRTQTPGGGALGPDGEQQEKGLLASVAGGAGGAFLGNKLMHGKMGKLMGGAAGAVVANIIESKLKGKDKHHGSSSSHQQSYGHSSSGGGGGLLGGLMGGGSSSSHHGAPSPYQQPGGYTPPPQPQYYNAPAQPQYYGGQPPASPYGQPPAYGHHGKHGSHGHHGHHGSGW